MKEMSPDLHSAMPLPRLLHLSVRAVPAGVSFVGQVAGHQPNAHGELEPGLPQLAGDPHC